MREVFLRLGHMFAQRGDQAMPDSGQFPFNVNQPLDGKANV